MEQSVWRNRNLVGKLVFNDMMTLNDIKKELLKSKATANFSHYTAGNLYYNVVICGDLYQFPIPTIEHKVLPKQFENPAALEELDTDEKEPVKTIELSSDLGTTSFYSGMKASELNRWIAKAVEHGEFIKIS